MAAIRYWLIFDIGLSTPYEKLFAWLDENGAAECGDNAATFMHEKTFEQMVRELRKLINGGARAYLIGHHEKGRSVGRFILGRRKAPPWAGFGNLPSSDEKDEG
jgi:hypothetical protein